VIDTLTNRVVGSPIPVGLGPALIAIAPEGTTSTTASNLKVRVKCPARARRGGCKFKLQAVSKKPRGNRKARSESAVAKAKVKAGRSALVSLKPKPAFAPKLAAAKNILVKATVKINGSTQTQFRRLKVIR
jgi:hypothetical protein